jgi:hypothetical protein
MPIAISLYNSTAGDISVSDLPTPVVVPAKGSVAVVPPNSQTDVQNSLILREGDLQGKLGVIINGNQVKLSNLAIMVGAPASGGLTPASFVDNEIPAGVIDGVNDIFTLANTPVAGSVHLYKNGARQTFGAGNDAVIAGDTITFEPGNTPMASDSLLADYRK